MKLIAKSVVVAVVATGLFFFFLMIFAVPAMSLMARSQGAEQVQNVVVDPNPFLRHIGLPLSGIVFLSAFGMSLWQSAKARRGIGNHEPASPNQSNL